MTGPAHEPRPTSSIPTTTRSPAVQHFRSWRSVGNGTGHARGRYDRLLSALAQQSYDAVRPAPTSKSAPASSSLERGASRSSEIVQTEGAEPLTRLRRRSDGSSLPVLFDADDLREERRRSTWWIS